MTRRPFVRSARRAAIAGSLLAGASAAQDYPLWSADGFAASAGLGGALASLGDLDGDAVPDLVASGAGFVQAFSGAGGTLIYTVFAPFPALFSLAPAVAGVGDVDGDGKSEFALGASTPFPFFGLLSLHLGASGAVLWSLTGSAAETLGLAVAGPGDVDGDGVPDVAAGGNGFVRLFSGSGGSVLFTATSALGGRFGRALAPAGDLDGDGAGDLFAGSPGIPFLQPAGPALAISGASGSFVQTFAVPGGSPGFDFGLALAAAGDLDGDGLADLIVGTPQEGQAAPPISGGTGAVHVFSGGSGAVLLSIAGTAVDDRFGYAVAGAGDVDGDGVPDVAAGAPQQGGPSFLGSGYVRICSGANAAPIFASIGAATGDRYGSALAGGGDGNADGVPDLVAGAPAADPGGLSGSGRVRFFSFVGIPQGGTVFGAGCPGTGGRAPRISVSGGAPESTGNPDFAVHLSNARPSAPALWIIGLSSTAWLGIPLPLDLAPFSMPGCSLYVAADVLIPFATSATGRTSIPLATPADPAFAGFTIFFQWFVVDPGPAILPGVTSAGLGLVVL